MEPKERTPEEWRSVLTSWREKLTEDSFFPVKRMPTSNISDADNPLREKRRQLVIGIDNALGRIAAGTFGICENCDTEIEKRRLEANPLANQCVDCKSLAEEEAAGNT